MPLRSADPDLQAKADLAACRQLLRNGSRTFLAASRLLPRHVADAACALYAFCRTADDLIDDPGADAEALDLMRERLTLIYAGRPLASAADRSFARVVAHYQIDHALPAALLEGFAWDIEGRRYQDLEALQAYAARVAGAVGAMMAVVMGVRDANDLARACDLGVAMQLSNIARDVGEDARMGRIYLPLSWLHEAGIDADALLRAPRFDTRLAQVIARLLAEAQRLYQRAADGVASLPWACRPAIQLASALYAEIGREVARRGHDSISSRAVVSPTRKLGVAASSLRSMAFVRPAGLAAPLASTRFLVEAAQSARARDIAEAPVVDRAMPVSGIPFYRLDRQAEWLVELFLALEHRNHPARGLRHPQAMALRGQSMR